MAYKILKTEKLLVGEKKVGVQLQRTSLQSFVATSDSSAHTCLPLEQT